MSNLKITALNVRDFRCIKVANMSIDPEKGLTSIGGDNGNGKTSALLAIEHALTSVKVPSRDREGGDGAKVRVIVSRETPDGWEPAFKIIRSEGKLSVYLADQNAEVQRPAEWAKQMVTQAFVDPVDFLNAEPRDQRQMFLDAIGVDTKSVDAEIRQYLDAKKDAERVQLAAKAKAADLPEYPDLGTTEKSAVDIANRLNDAHSANLEIDRQRRAHEEALATVKRLEEELAAARLRLESTPMPKTLPVDTSAIETEFRQVEETNAKVRANIAKVRAREEWQSAEESLKVIVENLEAARKAKLALMASADLPLPNLSVDEETILLNGQPLAAASDAERIQVAVALATHGEAKLKVLLIKNASLIGNRILAQITEIAQARGAQVFAEIVSNKQDDGSYDRVTDFVFEDGELAGTAPEQPTLEAITG